MAVPAAGEVTCTAYTELDWDALDNLTQIRQRREAGVFFETSLEYDSLSRLVRAVADSNGLALESTFEYDFVEAGCGCGATLGTNQVAKSVDPTGATTYYRYDAFQRVTDIIRKLGDVNPAADANDGHIHIDYDDCVRSANRTPPHEGGCGCLGDRILHGYDYSGWG